MGKITRRTAYGVTILKASHQRVRQLKKDHEPEIHGNKLWNSSFLVMDYLDRHGLPPGSRVMEVGCGWGLLGIYCAKNHGAEVLGIDADAEVFPYLHLHAEVNGVALRTQRARFESLTRSQLTGTRLLVGADICFWDEMVDPLYRLIARAVKVGVEQVIVADPGRPPFDEVCERAERNLGGKVEEWDVTRPVKAHGWLLVVGSLPSGNGKA